MIKACVIGLSKIGLIHCESLKKIHQTQLTYVFDNNFKLGNKIAKKYKCNTAKNFSDILKIKDIKLFIVATPTNTHEHYIRKLIAHNKMIYCEKPILMNNKKLGALIKRIKSKKIKICIGLNRRFSNIYIKMKKIIKDKKIERIQIISRSFNINVEQSVRNGGLFMDKGFHFFDLACWLTSSSPRKIITIAEPLSTKEYLERKDYSDAIINMKLKNNILVEFVFGRKCRFGQVEQIKIIGKDFEINSDNYFNKKYLNSSWDIMHKDTYYKCLKAFIKNGREYLLNEGILVQKICDTTLKSAQKN